MWHFAKVMLIFKEFLVFNSAIIFMPDVVQNFPDLKLIVGWCLFF